MASVECHPKLSRGNEAGKNIYIKCLQRDSFFFFYVKAARLAVHINMSYPGNKCH